MFDEYILNEMYFGKVPALLQLEELFEKIKIKYQKNSVPNYAAFSNMKKDPIFKTMSDIIKEQFGFDYVIVSPSYDKSCNCHVVRFFSIKTMGTEQDTTIDYKDIRKGLSITKSGFKFKGKAPSMLIILDLGFLLAPFLHPSEMVAVLLHEIGHNFTKTTMDPEDYSDRVDEKFADAIVSMYGYGPDLASGLNKMVTSNKYSGFASKLRNKPILNIGLGLYNIYKDIVHRQSGLEEHLPMDSRAEDIVKQLEYDLDNTPDISDDAKREIQDQIRAIKIWIAKFNQANNYMPDKMMRFYSKHLAPHLGNEKLQDSFVKKHGTPEVIHKRITQIYNSGRKN